MNQRCVTLWRKADGNMLDWDFYVSESLEEAARVVANIREQGVLQYSTYPIGERVADMSSEY